MGHQTPNIIFVFADQMRGEALGCMGNEQVRTPNLDALASKGMLFERAYSVDPVCGPARGSILTGCYPHRHGVLTNNLRLDSGGASIAECLSRLGYTTGYIGKWHLDGVERPGFVPPERRAGFRVWHGFNRGHNYWKSPLISDDGEIAYATGYEPELQTNLAVQFLERYQRAPFFVVGTTAHPACAS